MGLASSTRSDQPQSASPGGINSTQDVYEQRGASIVARLTSSAVAGPAVEAPEYVLEELEEVPD